MPVYPCHLVDAYADLRLGERVRAVRQRQELTLRDLAERTGMSMSRLSRIENDLHVLDVHQALVLAEALGISWEELLPAATGIPFQISREAQAWKRRPRAVALAAVQDSDRVAHHNVFRPLADVFVGRHLEPLLGQVMSVSDDDVRFYYHHEQVFAFVLKGSIELLMRTPDGLVNDRASRGDCIFYRSEVPHCLRAVGDEPAQVIYVLTSTSAPPDTGFEWPTVRPAPNDAAARVISGIGERVKALREARGWTIAQVAQRAGLRERKLVQIERGERTVRLDALLTLARAFSKPVREFLDEHRPPGPYYVVQRVEDSVSLQPRVRKGHVNDLDDPARLPTHHPLASQFVAPHMFPYFVRFQNPDRDGEPLDEHNGQQFVYVLDGELELTTHAQGRQVVEVLRPGDSLYLDSSVPHHLRGRTRNPYSPTSAEVIKVFWCPLGEDYLFERLADRHVHQGPVVNVRRTEGV